MAALSILTRVVADLETAGLRFALVGGLAVSVWAEPRFTADVDFAVTVAGDEAAEAICRTLGSYGYRTISTSEHESLDRLAAARLALSGTGIEPVVDLLFASSGIEPEIVAGAVPIEILPGVVVPVASLGHLIALKLLSENDATRPNDGADLLALAAVCTEHDWRVSQDSITLIRDRGFHRNRDLDTALVRLRLRTS